MRKKVWSWLVILKVMVSWQALHNNKEGLVEGRLFQKINVMIFQVMILTMFLLFL